MPGAATRTVFKTLTFQPGTFHLCHRSPHRHISNLVRGRLPLHVSLSALTATATLMPGPATRTVFKTLTFQPGTFHLCHRSNEWENVQILLRTLHTLWVETYFRIYFSTSPANTKP
ncbi:hypothetical protein C8F04DRAFT_1257536 [Mycena alexandri]|uniref:Uncharacterized protein n=1 Tax=Mycena alexandri TaxID=1745969 RepID=A0AAD6T325_9AGAR|nr:hypothetical protein C8F04DRAFT_1257536 [Mycena alexandri]